MAKPTMYQVTAPMVMLTSHTAQGPRKASFLKDAIVPPDVPDQEVKDHLIMGLIAEVGVWENMPDPEPPAESRIDPEHYVPEASPAPARPKRDDPKHTWVSYAVNITQGTPEPLPREAADALSKHELIERFGGS